MNGFPDLSIHHHHLLLLPVYRKLSQHVSILGSLGRDQMKNSQRPKPNMRN